MTFCSWYGVVVALDDIYEMLGRMLKTLLHLKGSLDGAVSRFPYLITDWFSFRKALLWSL